MDITDYAKKGTDFLKAADVLAKPQVVFVITSEGELVTSEKFGNERLHLQGEFDKEFKVFDCSKTNSRTIVEKLGVDSKAWVGKTLKLEVYKTKTSDGKLVDAINIKEVL